MLRKIYQSRIFLSLSGFEYCSSYRRFKMSLTSDLKEAVEASTAIKFIGSIEDSEIVEDNHKPGFCPTSDHKKLKSAQSLVISDEKLVDIKIASCNDVLRSNNEDSFVAGDLNIPIDNINATTGKSKNMMKKEKRRAAAKQRKIMAREHPDIVPDKRKLNDFQRDENAFKKAKLEKKAKQEAVNEQLYAETSYYFENGLRKVHPYYFTFTTHAKGRWVGKKIYDVFAKEFRAIPPEEFNRCIEDGSITVNSKKVQPDFVLNHNDVLANIVHRHEVPVTDAKIPIVYMDEKIVVIDKPSSIPVHPCGRYRHNSISFILGKDYGLKDLFTVHRLDRLTSGVLMFGRSSGQARILYEHIQGRLVEKEYVCRVDGEFPSNSIVCEEPIEVMSFKIGVCRVSPQGKDCKTEFKLLSYNGKSSVVRCKPHTGRMHQIRVHLQYLGFPIVNDPLYNSDVFGPTKGKGGVTGKTDQQLLDDLLKVHTAENWLGTNKGDDVDLCSTSKGDDLCSTSQYIDKHCYECKFNYKDPQPEDLVMYLHALCYTGPGWSYKTDMPAWAKPDWKE